MRIVETSPWSRTATLADLKGPDVRWTREHNKNRTAIVWLFVALGLTALAGIATTMAAITGT
jgi:hypothetical protein